MNSKTIGTLLATGCLLAYGCGDPNAGSSELATRLASGGDGAASACESNLDCPQGEECEFEHGESFCKPHGGDDDECDEDSDDHHDDDDDRHGSNGGHS